MENAKKIQGLQEIVLKISSDTRNYDKIKYQ